MTYLKHLAELAAINDYNLYHTTDYHKAFNILKGNEFHLSLAETNSSEARLSSGTAKLWYMSFARTTASGYIADRSQNLRAVQYPILFVFDRRKLNKRKVIFKPVEYYKTDGSGRNWGAARESEERMFHDEPRLRGITPSIKEIRVYLDRTSTHSTDISYLRRIYILASKLNIPIKAFSLRNKAGYHLGKEKSEDHAFMLSVIKGKGEQRRGGTSFIDMYRTKITKKRYKDGYTLDWIDILGEYVRYDNYSDLSKRARSRIAGSYTIDFADTFRSDLHNSRTEGIDRKERLQKLLKQTGARTLSSFFTELSVKWSSILNRK